MPATSSAPGSKPEAVKTPKPRKARRTTPSYETPNATLGGQEVQRSHAAAVAEVDPQTGNLVGRHTKRAKRIRQEQKQARAYARARKDLKRQEAKAGTVAQQIDRFQHPEAKSYDIFTDKQGHPEHFSDYAPTYTKVYRALTGTDPYASDAKNVGKLVEVLAETAIGGRAGATIGAVAKAKTAERTVAAAKAAEEAVAARSAASAEKVAQASTKAGKTARRAEAATKARYAAQARKLRRAKRIEHAAHNINPVTGVAASTKQGRALIEGTATADPVKSLKTTARAIPASLAFGATAIGDVARAAATQDTGPLKGLAAEAKASVEALAPLISGDPAKVRAATENTVGYVGAPLIPKGISTAAKLTRPLAEDLASHIPHRIPDHPETVPGNLRRAKQVATGRKTRKRVSVLAARETQTAKAIAQRVAHEIDKPLRKAPKARSFKNRKGLEAGDTVATLARYGIDRSDPLGQLERVQKSLTPKDAPAEVTTLRHVVRFARENPEVLASDHVWAAVDAYKGRVNETSPTAKFRGQGDVFDVTPPEDRVPVEARAFTAASTRGQAWADWKQLVSKAKAERKKGDTLRAQAKEATGLRRDQLLMQAEASRQEFKSLTAQAKDFHRSLDPYVRPGQSLEGKRTRWTKPLVDEYVAEVQKAAKDAGFTDPAWVSERGPGTVDPASVGPKGAKPGPRMQHVKTGESARTDVADRSLRALVSDSVWRPRMQEALNRLIRRTVEEFSVPVEVGGHRVTEVTSDEWNQLVSDKQIDPREVVALPSRDYKQTFAASDFENFVDLGDLHKEFVDRLKGEIKVNAERDGSKYVVMPREAAMELADQINPSGGGLEAGLSSISGVGSRIILFSPAWVTSQIVAEGLQAAAAVGPLAWTRAARTLSKLKREDPAGYEAFSAQAGASPASLEQPHNLRVSMAGDTQQQFRAAGRALRRTPVGRALYSTATLRVFGLLDRWKSGKYRTVIAAAKADREFNGFVRGLQGMMREQDAIAKKLAPMSHREQLSYVARHPEVMDRHLDYVDDVMGNWQAFTRYERKLAPLVMFYPYLRMSFRWTFWSYPKNHPVRAQMLYLLGQQNSNEIDKLLGDGNAKFINYAMPILHGSSGQADAVLPGGQRFGAPGLNTLVQTIGEDNYTGLARALTPALSIPFYFGAGLNPMSGEQDIAPGDLQGRGLLALNQLLSLSPEVRLAGLNRVGQGAPSPAAQKFQSFDPQRGLRSFAVPFLPQSAADARRQAELSRALKDSGAGVDSEYGQLFKLADEHGIDGAKAILEAEFAGKAYEKKHLPPLPDATPAMQDLIDYYNKLKYGGGSSSSAGGAAQATFGGSGGSAGGAAQQVWGG